MPKRKSVGGHCVYSATEDNLVLNVSQFRNLPDYASDNVVIRDSEIQINRALSYGTLDDRVISLELTEAGMDGGLTLNVATAEKLGDRNIRVVETLNDGNIQVNSAPLVIRDRASAIANFIETGSLPEMGSVMFVESRGETIELNDEQWNAYENLSEYINVIEHSPTGDRIGAIFEERSIEEYIDDRLSDLSKALDASDPLAQYDEWRSQKDVEDWFEKADNDWEAKEVEADIYAVAEAEAVVTAEGTSDWNDKLVEREGVQTNAVNSARTEAEDLAWSGRLLTLDDDIENAQDQAVDSARLAEENQAWNYRLITLDDDIENAQDQAVDSARTNAENQAWSDRLSTLDDDIENAQDQAVDSARTNAVNQAWEDTLDAFGTDLQIEQDQRVADVKADINNPIAYLHTDTTGDGIAETESIPQSLEAGGSFTVHVMVSAIDTEATQQAGALDLVLSIPDGLTQLVANSGDLFGNTIPMVSNDGAYSYAQSVDADLGVTGNVAKIAFENTTNEAIDTSSLSIQFMKIGDDFAYEIFDEPEFRDDVARVFSEQRGINEESVKLTAAQQFDSNTAVIESIKLQAAADYVALDGNNEGSVKMTAAQQFDNNTAVIESIKLQAAADYVALDGNNEGSVKMTAAQQFDTDTALIQSIKDQAEIDYTALPGNNEIDVKLTAAQQFDADTALNQSIRAEAGAIWDAVPGNNEDSVRAAAHDAHFEDAYDSASEYFFAQTGNSRAEVLEETIKDHGDIRTTAPAALYERLLSEINGLEQKIDTNVTAKIEALGLQIETNVSDQLEALIDAIGLQPILDAQANYDQYLSDKAAYDANPTGSEPTEVQAPATMLANLNASITAIGIDIDTKVSNQLQSIIGAIGLQPILNAQSSYEQYLSAKAAYDANPIGTEPTEVDEPATMLAELITAIDTGDTATKQAVLEKLSDVEQQLGDVEAVVDKLDSEFITAAEFAALDSIEKGETGVAAGNSYQISDTAANIADLLDSTLDPTITLLVPNNGAKLQLNANQLRELDAANEAVDYKLFSGFIDLSDTLENLTDLPDSALKSASSYFLTDTKANVGEVSLSLQNITVSAGVVLKGADNSKDYLYKLSDNTENLSAQDVDTVAVVSAATTVTVTDPASLSQLGTIHASAENTVIYGTIVDDSGNLTANSAGYVTGDVDVIINDDISVSVHNSIRSLTTGDLTYSILDSSSSLLANLAEAVLTKATDISIENDDAGEISVQNYLDLASITSDTSWSYTLSDSLSSIHSSDGQLALVDASSYSLTDAATAFTDLAVADVLSATEKTALTDATNAGDYTYTLDDTLDAIVSAGADVNTSYSLTDSDATLVVSVSDQSVLASATNASDYNYELADTANNLNNAASSVLKASTAIAVDDDGTADNGSTLDLHNTLVDGIGSITSLSFEGDQGANIVQLSSALTDESTSSIDMGAGDDSIDQLIFNMSSSSTYLDETDIDGGATFDFNTVDNFNMDSDSSLDQLGIFYGSTSLIRSTVLIDDSVATLALRVTDGKLYEDELAGLLTADEAADSEYIRENIASIISFGGVRSATDGVGTDQTDFLYMAYGQSSDDTSETSAYVYAGYHDGSLGATAPDNANLYIKGVAEITGVTFGDFNTDIGSNVTLDKDDSLT